MRAEDQGLTPEEAVELPGDDWFDAPAIPARVGDAKPAPPLFTLAEVPDGTVIERGDPPVLVRAETSKGIRYFLDHAFPSNRSGRKRIGVDAIHAVGDVGRQLLERAAEHCRFKAPTGLKVYLRGLKYLADGLADKPAIDSAEDIPARVFDTIEAGLLSAGGMADSVHNYLNCARQIVEMLPGARNVETSRTRSGDLEGAGGDGPDGPTDGEIEDLIRQAMKRVLEVMAAQRQIEAFVAGEIVSGPNDREAILCALHFRESHPAGPPSLEEVVEGTLNWRKRIKEVGYRKVVRLAYPLPVDMVPFLVLLAFYTRLNPSVLAGIKLSEIKPVLVLDNPFGLLTPGRNDENGDRVELEPWKGRSGRHQHVSFPASKDPDNPDRLIGFVREWTSGIREGAGLNAEHLFIYATSNTYSPHAQIFVGSGSEEFVGKMKQLCEAAGVRPITPKELRPAAVDAIFQESGGDMAIVRASGWWRDLATPEKVYLGPRTRRRGEEDLHWFALLEERRRLYGIDVATRPPDMDRGAATPGWICYDPLSGPLRTKKGELCSAVGHCPICPYSDVDESSVTSFAWIVALGKALLAKLDHVHEEQWSARWEPMLDSVLVDWLPLFPEDVAEKARSIPQIEFPEF